MSEPIQLPDLTRLVYYDGGGVVLPDGREGVRQLLGMVLALAVKDGAASVHYHSWRDNAVGGNVLSYVVAGVRYELVPPPPQCAGELLAAARSLIDSGGIWAAVRRLLSWATGACSGRIQLRSADGDVSEWCGVLWSAGGVEGVEFYRLSPEPVAAGSTASDPAEGGAGQSNATSD